MSKTILRIDASLLKESYCSCKIHRTGVIGYREPITNIDTQYGTAVHAFISTMYRTNGNVMLAKKDAIEVFHKPTRMKPSKKFMTDVHLLKTCFDVWQSFVEKESNFQLFMNPSAECYYCKGKGYTNNESTCLACDGKGIREEPCVELNFAFPYYENEQFIVLLCGTIDRIGRIKNGCVCIPDWKTSSAWDENEYLMQYNLSVQLQFYVFALYEYAKLHPENTFLQEITKGRIGTRIDGIFIKGSKECVFKSSEVFLKYSEPKNLERFKKLLDVQISKLISLASQDPEALLQDPLYRQGLINGTCHNGWGLCKYFHACSALDLVVEKAVLRNQFIIKPYDPLSFND